MKTVNTARLIPLMAALVLSSSAVPSIAQEDAEAPPEPNWKNEVGLSYVGTSGNTDTSSLGLDFKSERKPTPWGLNLIATFTRAEDSGEVTAEQYFVGGRGTRQLSDRWNIFAGLSWARDTFETPERFFARFFIANYCPLAFFEESGRNRTPDRLRAAVRDTLFAACDLALRRTVEHLKPRYVVGIGRFAEARAKSALTDLDVSIGRILHPSPASPAANRNWPAQATADLATCGIRLSSSGGRGTS